jgi:HD-GYP domain-containing protein (c-di-GMP phosphodiesterase class II)
MSATATYKRQYFRVDTVLPLKVNLVPRDSNEPLQSKTGVFHDLKPALVNISAGGMCFRSSVQFMPRDIIEILLILPERETGVCIYGEVLRSEKTTAGNFKIFVKFVIISDKIREIIANFVFSWEREKLKNTQLSANIRLVDIPMSRLILDSLVPCDIYARKDNSMQFLFSEGFPFNALTKEYFEEIGISKIYIDNEELPKLYDYIDKNKIKTKAFDKEDHLSFKEYSFKKRNHHHIDKSLLITRREINFSLYTVNNFTYTTLIEIDPGLPVIIDENIKNASGDIVINNADIPLYLKYLISLSESDMAAKIPNLTSIFIRENAKIALHDLFMEAENKNKVKAALAAAKKICYMLSANPDSLYPIISARPADLYNYVHGVNVAAMAVSTGIAMKLNEDDLYNLAAGALLHDIGHIAINDEVINKQGKLVKTEYEFFKTHVPEGARILKGHEYISDEMLNALMHHHEKTSGSGYPYGLLKDEISLFGKIVAVADAYDLMTTARPYREPQKSIDALAILAKKDIRDYDPEILKFFIRILGKAR